jgi:hypothetical protein
MFQPMKGTRKFSIFETHLKCRGQAEEHEDVEQREVVRDHHVGLAVADALAVLDVHRPRD